MDQVLEETPVAVKPMDDVGETPVAVRPMASETPVAVKPPSRSLSMGGMRMEDIAHTLNKQREVNAVDALQGGKGFNRATLHAITDEELAKRHRDLSDVASQQADALIHSAQAFEGDTPSHQLAQQRLLDTARDHVKANPHDITNAPLARGMASVPLGMIARAKQNSGEGAREVQMEKALQIARHEADPYGQAISGAVGSALSPQFVGGAIAAAPVEGASMIGSMARGAGVFGTLQTGEQAITGEPITPVRNYGSAGAMMVGGAAAAPIGEALGGGANTLAARAIGGGVGGLGGTMAINAAEGRETTNPEALAQTIVGAAQAALPHSPYVEHVREAMKQGKTPEESHAIANELTKETPAAQPAPSVSESTPIAAKEIANVESVRNPNEAGDVARGGNEPAPAPVVEPSVPEVVAGKGNVAESQSRDVAPQVSETPVAVKPAEISLEARIAKANQAVIDSINRGDSEATQDSLSKESDALVAESVAKYGNAQEARKQYYKYLTEREAPNAIREPVAKTQIPIRPETPQVREGVRGGNAKGEETPLQVPQGEGRGPAKPASENAVTENEGPGAASGADKAFTDTAAEQDPATTGIKKAVIAETRKRLGIDELPETERRGWEEDLKRDPERTPERILNQLREQPNTLLNSSDWLKLGQHMVTLENKLASANKAIGEAYGKGDAAGEDMARADFNAAVKEIDNFTSLVRDEGRGGAKAESGRALAAQRAIFNMDYSLSKMLSDRTMIEGRKLTPEEVKEVTAAHAEIDAQKQKVFEADAVAQGEEAEAAAKTQLEKVKEEAAAEGAAVDPRHRSIAKRITDYLDKISDAAEARIRARGAMVMSGIDPANLADYTIVGSAQIAKGFLKFGEWSSVMVKKFGDGIKPHLQEIYDASNNNVDKVVARFSGPKFEGQVKELIKPKPKDIIGKIKERAKEGGNLHEYLNELALEKIKGGIKDLDPLLKALHDDVKGIIPGITVEQVRDIFSNRGKSTIPNQESAHVIRRDLKQQSILSGNIADVEAGNPPPRTGPSRDAPSIKAQALRKQLNEAKKKYGIVTTNPERQLKSTLDSMKTRVKNRRDLLKLEIDTGKRTVKGERVKISDAELESLKSELAEVEKLHKEVFEKEGLTDAQKLKMATASAEANLKLWQKRAEDARKGIFALPKTGENKVSGPELESIKQQAQAAKLEYDELKSAANPPRTESQKKEQALIKQRELIDEKILSGDTSPLGKTQGPDTEAVARAKSALAQSRKQLADMKAAANPQRRGEEVAIEKRIAALEKMIADEKIQPRGSKQGPDTAYVTQLKAQRTTLNEQIEQMRQSDPVLKAQREVDAAESRMDELNRKRTAGEFIPEGKTAPSDTPEVKAAREKLAEARKAYDEARDADPAYIEHKEKQSDAAYIRNLSRRAADMAAAEARGDFMVRPKPKPTKRSQEALIEQGKYEELKRNYEEKKRVWERSKRSTGKKMFDAVVDVAGLSKGYFLGGDLSYVLNQGGRLLPEAPLKMIQAFKMLSKAAFSKEYANAKSAEHEKWIEKNKDIGLNIISDRRPSEMYVGRLIEKTPVMMHAERGQRAYLNEIMIHVADKMLRPDMSPAERKAVGSFVNDLAQRTTFGQRGEALASSAAAALISPRSIASQFKMALINPAKIVSPFHSEGMTPRVRARMAVTYAKYIGLMAGVYAIAAATGADTELDPRSPGFGTIRYGKRTINPLSGLAGPISLLAQLMPYFGGLTKKRDGTLAPNRGPNVKYGADTGKEKIEHFFENRSNPWVSLVKDFLTGKNYDGTPFTAKSAAYNYGVPLGVQNIIEQNERDGIPANVTMTILSMLGVRTGIDEGPKNPKEKLKTDKR